MRGVLPVFLVVLGLSAREYVDLNVPGGLAFADRATVVDLAQETAIAWYEGAPPQARRVLQRMFSNMDTRDGRRSARRHRLARQGRNTRHGFANTDRSSEPDQLVEVTFVLPVKKTVESETRRIRRGERRRR